jgi:hypothetical protein
MQSQTGPKFTLVAAKVQSNNKNNFWAKTLILSFCQKYVLAIFKLFKPLKLLLIFLPNEYFLFPNIF